MTLARKGLVIVIILLFVGTCLISSTAQNIEKSLLTSRGNWLYVGGSGPGDYSRIQDAYYTASERWISKTDAETMSPPVRSCIVPNPLTSPMPVYDGKTLYVGGTGPGNYTWIQLAVNAASPGDTVFVYSDMYRQNPIMINKSIRLLGEDPDTTILENYKHVLGGLPIIDISESDGVTVQGFTIRNILEMTTIFDYANGIEIGTGHNNISINIFEDCSCGIYASTILGSVNYNTFSDNIFRPFSDNIFRNVSMVGIYLLGAEYTHVAHNRFYGVGLGLYDSFHSTIEDNFVNDKPLVVLEGTSDTMISEAGQVLLINCQNITVRGVDVSNTTIGIYLRDSRDCLMEENIVNGEKDVGIFLEYSSNNIFSRNHIQNSVFGMLLGASLDNTIVSNEITQNSEAGLFLSYSTGNILTENTFTDNAYWSIYMGLVLTSYSDFTTVANNTFIRDCVFVYGSQDNQFSNNTVDDYPLIYLEGASDKVVDEVAGQIILNGCENIDVRGQKNITKTDVLMVSCLNCNISNISTPSRFYGMYIAYSQGITITSCLISDSGDGLFMENCSYCLVERNTFTGNKYTGLLIYPGTKITIRGNAFIDNGGLFKPMFGGLVFRESTYNSVVQNNFIDNYRGQAFEEQCKGNTFDGNYWDRPRILPKLIWGTNIVWLIPKFVVDWHPAKEPYDV
jgi:parallel beta-helix repeat protein